MQIKFKISALFSFILALMCSSCRDSRKLEDTAVPSQERNSMKTELSDKKPHLQIILGSTRQGRTSDKIGNALKNIANQRSDITTEILDLNDYNLPFFNDETPPAKQESIADSIVRKWSNKINEGDAFIIVVPEYNSGYPGVLKNALDSLYREWNNKPVAFVGYSGGPAGGSNAITQLNQVALALKMKPVSSSIKIPNAWKAFDEKKSLTNPTIASEFNTIIDQIKSRMCN